MNNNLSSIASDEPRIMDDSWDGFWEKYRVIIITTALATIFLVGFYFWTWMKKEHINSQAQQSLSSAKSPDELQSVINQFRGTDAAAMAMIRLATHSIQEGQLEEAAQRIEKFIEAYPKHPLSEPLKYSLAQSLQISGKKQEAIRAYHSIIQTKELDGFKGLATLALADLYEKNNQTEDARSVLTQFIESSNESAYLDQAQRKLQSLPPSPTPQVEQPSTPPAPPQN